MTKLKIQSFGPIGQGYEAGFMEINDVTVFIGDQGSGKSTIAKVYSTLSWIEKALIRGDFKPNYLTQYNRFKKQLGYQNLENYFKVDTLIEYRGEAYEIIFRDGYLQIERLSGERFEFPKIMYVPAERNFLSVVEKPSTLKRLPSALYTFLDEYEDAKQSMQGPVDLPIGNVSFEYRKQNKASFIAGENYKIKLQEASSGFQSVVPLFLVTQYLTESVGKSKSPSRNNISVDEKRRIEKEVDRIYANPNISAEVRDALLEKLSSRFAYSSLINVVEEPEQNLFPSSQKDILYSLLKFRNRLNRSKLVITTHSPYVINYLTLAIKAKLVSEKYVLSGYSHDAYQKINRIVPSEAQIRPDQLIIYQLTENGRVERLPDYAGIPSDDNYLNKFLMESNALYDQLLEIEDEL